MDQLSSEEISHLNMVFMFLKKGHVTLNFPTIGLQLTSLTKKSNNITNIAIESGFNNLHLEENWLSVNWFLSLFSKKNKNITINPAPLTIKLLSLNNYIIKFITLLT